jgi:hypothetical protein
MDRFRMIATWYSTRNNWVRLPLDIVLFAIVIFAIAALLFHLDPRTINPRPTLAALWFALCFAPVFGFTNVCLPIFPSRKAL